MAEIGNENDVSKRSDFLMGMLMDVFAAALGFAAFLPRRDLIDAVSNSPGPSRYSSACLRPSC